MTPTLQKLKLHLHQIHYASIRPKLNQFASAADPLYEHEKSAFLSKEHKNRDFQKKNQIFI